jgi:DNA-binding FadR family transcriptional regulator
VRSFVLALADATLNPATAFLTVYLTGTVIALRTWPPQRPVSTREAARVMAARRALLAAVKARWAA